MAVNPLNSIGGFSINDSVTSDPITIIDSNGNISTNTLSITGTANFEQASTVTLGPASNVKITGGTANYVLQTDGLGNLSWVAQSGGGGNGSPGGSNTQVQFNDANTFAGNANFTFDKTTGILSAPSIVTSNSISATGTITGGNIGSANNISATGTLSGGNINTAGDIAATGNGSFGNISTSGTLNASSNTNLLANLYVGGNTRINSRTTIGNPNAINRIDLYTNGYAYMTNLDVDNPSANTGNITAANLSISGNANINKLTVATLTTALGNLSVTGNITAGANITANNANLGNLATANFLQGDGYLISNLTIAAGSSILNGNSNVSVAPNANVTITVAGNSNVVTVTESNTYFNTNIIANANIFTTTVRDQNTKILIDGTSTWVKFYIDSANVLEVHDDYIQVNGNANISNKLSVTGNITGSNLITGGYVSATGNVTGSNLITGGQVSATGNGAFGNLNGGNLVTANFFSGDGYLLSNLTIAAGSQIINGNSNVSVAPNANVTITAEGNSNIVTVTGSNVILTKPLLGTNANFSVANITTLNSNTLSIENALNVNAAITANGSITGESLLIKKVGNITGTATIEGNTSLEQMLFVSGTSNLAHLNASSVQVHGNLDANNTVSANTITASITLSTTGNLSVSGNTTLARANVSGNINAGNINGGNLVTANFFSGDGYLISNLTVPAGTALINGTSNLYVDGNGNVRTSVAGVSNVFVVSNTGANISGTLSASGNANTDNLGTTRILATGNITTSELISNGNISGTNISATGIANITGNIIAGNANLGNLVTANFFTGDGYLLTNLTIPTGTAIINGNSNVLVTANSNILFTVNGTANVVKVTSSNLVINGNLVANAFANGSSNIAIVNNGAINISSNNNSNVLRISDTGVNANVTINALQGLSVAGNANVGNLGAIGFIAAAGEVSGGSLDTGGNLRVGGSANIGNLNITGIFSVVGNVTGGNLVTNGIANVAELLVGPTGANVNGPLVVTGNANIGNVTATLFQGNLSGTGNSNVGNLGVGNVIATTVSASGNITANNFIGNFVGNLAGNIAVGSNTQVLFSDGGIANGNNNFTYNKLSGLLSIAGNANVGNLTTGGLISASGNITSGSNIISDNILGRTGALTITSGGTNTNINLKPNGTGNIDANSTHITNISDPINPQDAATKNYVDNFAQGLHVHDSCFVATTGTLASASGGTVTYNNGTSGVGATLTTTGTYLLIDGANVQTVGTRILVKNEANAVFNGIYTYTSSTVLTRATDFDTDADAAGGDFVFVTSGSTQADTGWVQTTDNPTLGTSNIVWYQFAGAGTYTAGTGLTLTGSVFSVNNTQSQITSVGTLTTLTVSGNANIGNIGTGIITATGNITGANANLGNLVHANFISGTLTTAAQPNITSLGILGSLTSTGNILAGNVYANTGTIGASLLTGTLTTASQPNITSVGSLTGLTSTGTINFTGAGNVSLGAVGNVKITGGTANYVLQTDGLGNLSWVAQSGGGGSPGGSNTQVQFNDAGSFGGNAGLTFDKTSNVLSVSTIAITANLTANSSNGTQYQVLQSTGNGIAWGPVNPIVANNGATTSGTLTPTSSIDQYNMLGLTGTVTVAAPTGTPSDGKRLVFRIKDAGSSIALNWNAIYRSIGATLPTSTTANKISYVGCIYNSTDTFWDVIAVVTQA